MVVVVVVVVVVVESSASTPHHKVRASNQGNSTPSYSLPVRAAGRTVGAGPEQCVRTIQTAYLLTRAATTLSLHIHTLLSQHFQAGRH